MHVQIRFEGEHADVGRLVEQMRAGAPVSVSTGTVKRRRKGFVHVYAVASVPPYQSEQGPEGGSG